MSSRVLILILLMAFLPLTAYAAESVNDFEVELLPAEGQKNFSEGYFNIDAELGQSLTLNLRIKNNSDAPIELLVEAADSWTAEEGGILYGVNPDLSGENRILLTDLLDLQETITVAAHDVENIHYHVDIPTEARGTILGGITLTAADKGDGISMKSKNIGGSNYTFEQEGHRIVAVKLNLPDNTAAGLTLGKAKFDADDNQLLMRVTNGNSAVLENVQGTYTILDSKGIKLTSGLIDPFAMAPQSGIRLPIDLKGQVLEEGKYVLMVKGSADKKEFFAEENFSVGKARQEVIAGETIEASSGVSGKSIFLSVIITLAVLFSLIPLLMKLLKRNEKNPYLNLSDKNNY